MTGGDALRDVRAGRAAYAALLRAYPASFRRRYAAELVEAFEAQRSEPRYRGIAGAAPRESPSGRRGARWRP